MPVVFDCLVFGQCRRWLQPSLAAGMDSLPVIDQELRPNGRFPSRRIHTPHPELTFRVLHKWSLKNMEAAIHPPPCCSREPCTNRTARTAKVIPFRASNIFGRHTLSLVDHVHGAGTSGLKRACIASLPRSRSAVLRIADGPAVRFSARAML